MKIEVTINKPEYTKKTDFKKPTATLTIDGEIAKPNYHTSRRLTNTSSEFGNGIFTDIKGKDVYFTRGNVKVVVDFGGTFDIFEDNPALEIKRRVELVEQAFQEFDENYTRVYVSHI